MSVRRMLVRARNRVLGVSMLQRSIDDLGRRIVHDRPGERFCPLCGFSGTFGSGPDGRPDACCPSCQSLERHRLIWMYLTLQTDLLRAPRRMLHFAPELGLVHRLQAVPSLDYVTGDLVSPLGDLVLDIQELPFADADFDFVLCSHVLEHVPDDRRAMRELFRVVRPAGTVLVAVPLRAGPTYEDPSIVTEAARRKHFGQSDHVRHYGADIVERLRAVGFEVVVERFRERFDERLALHLGLNDEVLFVCSKRAPADH